MPTFQPGKSGNPRGRPKGSRNLAAHYLAEVYAPTNGDPNAQTKLQAAIKAQVGKAVEGDLRAMRDVVERVEKGEAERSAERAPPFTDADREVIAEIFKRLSPGRAVVPPACCRDDGGPTMDEIVS
jgi:hypothetical protein